MYDFQKDIERVFRNCYIHELVDPTLHLTMRLVYLRGAIAGSEACLDTPLPDVIRAILKEIEACVTTTFKNSPGGGSTSNAKGDTTPPTP